MVLTLLVMLVPFEIVHSPCSLFAPEWSERERGERRERERGEGGRELWMRALEREERGRDLKKISTKEKFAGLNGMMRKYSRIEGLEE